MNEIDTTAAILRAYELHAFDEVDRLRSSLSEEARERADGMLLSATEVRDGIELRAVRAMEYLGKHRPGMSIEDALADLTPAELQKLREVRDGGFDDAS